MSAGGDERAPGSVAPRKDVALIEGYHSPQLDVAFRMNTNEAPEPPPPGFLDALQREIATLELNRYPDREARALREDIAAYHGVEPSQIYCANGSNEVLQSILLAYGGPGRVAMTFEPTYALHSHIARITGTIVESGERNEDFFIDEAEFARVVALAAEHGPGNPTITFVCSPNNPTGRLEPDAVLSWVLERAPGLVVVDEAYGQFAPRSAIEHFEQRANLIVVRTFSKTWSLAALRLGYAITTPEIVSHLEAVTLPYHLDALKQVAGRVALRYDAEMRARVARLVEERGRVEAALSALGVTCCPSDANFVLFRPEGKKSARAIWDALVARSILIRDVSSWPRLSGYLRVTIGTPEENDAFLTGMAEASFLAVIQRRVKTWQAKGMAREKKQKLDKSRNTEAAHRIGTRHRVTKESDVAVRVDLDGDGDVTVATGLPFFDHMVHQLGRHSGFDLSVETKGDLEVDAHHSVEDTGIALGEALAEALGDKAGVRRFATSAVPMDETLVNVALDLSGRSFLHYDVALPIDAAPLGAPSFDPQLAEEFWRAFVDSSGVTCHISLAYGKNIHHILEASFKAVARALRDAARRGGFAHSLDEGRLVGP